MVVRAIYSSDCRNLQVTVLVEAQHCNARQAAFGAPAFTLDFSSVCWRVRPFILVFGILGAAFAATPAGALQFFGNFNNNATTTDGLARNEDIITINNVLDPVGVPESLSIALDVTPLEALAGGLNLDAVDVLGGDEYLVSFKRNETLPSGAVQDEDIVVIDNSGGGLTTSLLVDVTSITPTTGGGGNRNLDVDAVHRFSDNQVLVSFDRDHNGLAPGLIPGGIDVDREDLVLLTFNGSGTVTDVSFFLDDPANLLNGSDLQGFTFGPDGLAGNFQYGSASNNGSTWSDEDALLITIAANQDKSLLSTADFIIIGASRALDVGGLETSALDGIDFLGIGVPEPGAAALLGFGLGGLILIRKRRRLQT